MYSIGLPECCDCHTCVNLNVSYDAMPGWDLSLLVRNLFDERYVERVGGASYYNFFGAPRAALLRAEYRFAL